MTTASADEWEWASRMVAGSVQGARAALAKRARDVDVRDTDYQATMAVYASVADKDRDDFVAYLAACVACAVAALARLGAREDEIVP